MFSMTENKSKSRRSSWFLALFKETNTYSVVPKNWILPCNNDSSLFAKWPTLPNVTSDIICAAANPLPEWQSFKIKLLDDGKEYFNFKKAWHRKVDYQLSESSSTEVDNLAKKKKYQHFVEESSDEDNHTLSVVDAKEYTELQNYNQPSTSNEQFISQKNVATAILQANNSFIPESITDAQEVNAKEYTKLQNYNQPSTSDEQFISQNSAATAILQANNSYIPESITEAQELNPQTHITAFKLFDDIQNQYSSVENQNNAFVNNNGQMDLLHHISQEQIEIKLVLNRILSKLDNLEGNSKHNTSTHLETDFLNHFPINSRDKFNEVNNFILNDLGFVDKLAYFIKTIGGNDQKNHINRALSKIFSAEFAVKCSWTGRGNKIDAKVGNSEILNILKKVVKESANTHVFTDVEFEKVVSDWLRYANTRLSRANKN